MKRQFLFVFFTLSGYLVFGQSTLKDTILSTGWYIVINSQSTGQNTFRTVTRSYVSSENEIYYIKSNSIIKIENLSKITYSDNIFNNTAGLRITLDKEGTKRWNLLTKESIGLNLGFVINDKLVYVWYVTREVGNGEIFITQNELPKEKLQEIETSLKKEKNNR